MIGILHGYLLEGSGSNLWTRSVTRSLCREGETIHLVCQENHPERYDFIAEAHRYALDGSAEVVFRREVPYEGRCVLHQPGLGDTLPVYVWDRYEEYAHVVPMIELPDDAIERYLRRNVEVVARVVRATGIRVLHANHAVLMSVVAQRVGAATGVPFAIMPHGSAIEYAVKKDERFKRYAAESFAAASRVFVIGREMRERVMDVLPGVPGLESKLRELNLGVETREFRPIPRSSRPDNIRELEARLDDARRGKTPELSRELESRLSRDLGGEALEEATASTADYEAKLPDAGLEAELDAVDWERDPVLLFVGRLIANKGVQSVIAALPLILEAQPTARLIIVGHGPLREPMEALLWALAHGHAGLARKIVARGRRLEGSGSGGLAEVGHFFGRLERDGALEAYFETARRRLSPDRVVFTGYLVHDQLRHLFACCDVAVFPSIVREAGPLVFLEALASGCFPLGTYFAGMAASIDSVADALPAEDAAWMKLSPDEGELVADIARKVPGALEVGGRHKAALRKVAVERYDWSSVARRLADELRAAAA